MSSFSNWPGHACPPAEPDHGLESAVTFVVRGSSPIHMMLRTCAAGFALLAACGVAPAQVPAQPTLSVTPAATFLPPAVPMGSQSTPSERIGAQALTLPVKVVDGHIVLGVTIYSQAGVDDGISLEVALDYPDALTLDGDQLGWLQLSGGAKGQNEMVRVKFSNGTTLLFPGKDIKEEKSSARANLHNQMTVAFSGPLEERKLKGMLGVGFLKNYQVTLDLGAQQLVLTPLSGSPPDPSGSGAGEFLGSFELKDGKMLMQIRAPSGGPAPAGAPPSFTPTTTARMILGSSNYDTLIDPEFAKRLGKPAGDVEPVSLLGSGLLELSQFVALRPKAWGQKPAEGVESPVLFSGVNFLESFKVVINWSSSRVRFSQQKDLPPAPKGDRAFFIAENTNTADGYQAFLEKYPTNRLAADAATRLMNLRLDEFGVTDEAVMQALKWVVDTALPERRLDSCIGYVNRFAAIPGKTALTIMAGELALKNSRGAVTVQHVYRLHRILGEQYLEQDNLPKAWSHLMSAAFVPLNRTDPDRALQAFRIALNLGRVYDRQGRTVRAYSRYKAAMAVGGAPITPAEKKEITEAIERLKKLIPPEDLAMLDS